MPLPTAMKYSIRDLFLLTFIVALAAGWWVDRSRLARRNAEWEEQFGDAMRLLSKESNVERTFDTPGGLWSVNRKPDPENQKREVIHVGDWHYIPRDTFAADLLANRSNYSADEIDDLYSEHLADVEAVQAEQVEQLKSLIRHRDLKHVWVEGLAHEDMRAFAAIVDTVKGSKNPNREILLRIGAVGRLLVSGDLAEVMPLEDEIAHTAAAPVNGRLDTSGENFTARESAMVEKLLDSNEPVCVIVLGAAHNLASQFDGRGVQYRRILSNKVQQLLDSEL